VIQYCQRNGLVIAYIFADVAQSAASVVGRDAFLDMDDMSADTELRPLLVRRRNWPRNRCGIGIIQCGAEIKAIISRLSQGGRGEWFGVTTPPISAMNGFSPRSVWQKGFLRVLNVLRGKKARPNM